MFTLAAEQGDATAQNKLAMMYEYGRGVAKNENAAHKWHRLASAQSPNQLPHEADITDRAAIAEQSGNVYCLSNLSLSKW